MNKPKYLISLLLIISYHLQAQDPGVNTDMQAYWQLHIFNPNSDNGSKIHLSSKNSDNFLRLGNLHENVDLFTPFISRSSESEFHFVIEDPESTSYQEQLAITTSGELRLKKLEGLTTRNLVVKPDGTIKAQSLDGYGGAYSITTHDFVSYNNPGDDHNFNGISETMHHEGVFDSEVLVAPVHLPHRAIIKKITVYYKDFNDSDSVVVNLLIKPHMNPYLDTTIEIGVTEYPGSPPLTQTLVLDTDLVVDNITNFYYIEAVNPNDRQRWPGTNVGISSVSVLYDLSEN